jgi:hypothetical protein
VLRGCWEISGESEDLLIVIDGIALILLYLSAAGSIEGWC